ncbi:uncharacterized protein M421DRAFT_417190 [Didymella exigua CBS 183.55]|uniref:Uncharacterized protein n=1 Tax=Didymella exigua CBS 183.55 TaxID=1150837 RepID=A0A6A5RZ18_9PLEO|nr:uncharacterized protein M421DRAFT_417190 [Didymella exigua CBS 183.55]KAF1932474.1 hypothetical protein M421DRAFT_417190 [Didymella exigua CBS 183.55]
MMQTTGEDYYDIPYDDLPSANFAARPTSEISELGLLVDGLWTFMTSISSSSEKTDNEDDIDDGLTPTALTSETPLMPQPKLPQTPPDTPAITVTSPSRRQSLRHRLRSVSDIVAIVRRPSTRQKSSTAPPGAFNSADYAPQVPRRAMSVRLEKQSAERGRHSRHLLSESDLKARKVFGMPEALLEEERPNARFSFERGSDSWEEDEELITQIHASFSRKPRVRETLERKQLARLRMNFVEAETDKFVSSPQSMLGTPVELYPPERQPGRFRPTSAINGRRGTSTPVSPKTPSPFRRPQPLSNNRFAGDENLKDLYRTRVYVPGPICLEKHPALLRKDSVATLDPFASEIDSIGRRPSDLMALEHLVVYFDGMGLNEEASDVCMDRYWLNGPQQALRETDFDLLELEHPLTPRSQQSNGSKDASGALSRFSFSSASSGRSVPQGFPQKRQLIRLRRLLSPALPGLKGSED